MWWFWLWILAVVLLLLMPLVYGWGYRGWGKPYPSFYRRKVLPTREASSTPEALGAPCYGAAIFWIALALAVTFFILAFVWTS